MGFLCLYLESWLGHDANTGGGYGRLGKPRSAGAEWSSAETYPYSPPGDPDMQPDEEDLDVFGLPRIDRDPQLYGSLRVDRGSFAHSSVRGLGELAVAKGMVPFPDMYSSMDASAGGMSPKIYQTAPARRTGSAQGWSSPPEFPEDDGIRSFSLWDVPTDDERSMLHAQMDHEEMVECFKDLFDLE